MHSKKNNSIKIKNFTQGLKPFSNSIPHGMKKILRKGGYNLSQVVDNWSKIVGKKLSNNCYPNTIKIGKDMQNGVLVLNVIHGKEVDVEYSKKEIIDKINVFFGYEYVKQITLRVIQEKKEIKKFSNKSYIVNGHIEKKLNSVHDNNLKRSLNKLVDAYKTKND